MYFYYVIVHLLSARRFYIVPFAEISPQPREYHFFVPINLLFFLLFPCISSARLMSDVVVYVCRLSYFKCDST